MGPRGLSRWFEHLVVDPRGLRARERLRFVTAAAGRMVRDRARRFRVHIEGRLRHADAAESEAVRVHLLDLSASGVRLWLPRDSALDLLRADRMYLHVRLESAVEEQALGLFVSLVRVAHMSSRRAELAFCFTYPSPETDRKLQRIHAHYFPS